jgi:hypothetical protein
MRSDADRRRWVKPLLLGILVGWLSLLILVIGLAVFDEPEVLFTSKQRQSVQYGSFEPYYLVIAEETDRSLSVIPPARYYIFIGRGPDPISYGHRVDFTFYPGGDTHSVRESIRRSEVQWSQDGVKLITESGHTLFIPKQMFLGGR